jgi:uncharacterized protein (DUF2235 family)
MWECTLLVHGEHILHLDSSDIDLALVRDTVSSIGFAREISLPETTTGMQHVCVFRHALALDERRVKFLPEYVNGGLGPESYSDNERMGERIGDVKEVWFSGTHSDM